jgi:septal ring factor EnvC (AmiA/AmiB activator)
MVTQILNARNVSKRIDIERAKAPADIESVLLGGASQAVSVLTNSLTWTQGEMAELQKSQAQDHRTIRTLQRSLEEKDVRIHEMEMELMRLRAQLLEVQASLDRAQTRIQEMREDSGNA